MMRSTSTTVAGSTYLRCPDLVGSIVMLLSRSMRLQLIFMTVSSRKVVSLATMMRCQKYGVWWSNLNGQNDRFFPNLNGARREESKIQKKL